MSTGIGFLLANRDPDFRPPSFDASIYDEVMKAVSVDTASHRRLLERQNGLYAFDRSLHVFGACAEPAYHGLRAWNDPTRWRGEYGDMAEGCVFFAENLLGDQYAFFEDRICQFAIETAAKKRMAESFNGWADRIREDVPYYTGSTVSARWETMKGQKRRFGYHFAAGQPFVLGGSYEPEDLEEIDQFQNAGFKAWVAAQLRDLPDGTPIRFSFE